MQKILLVIVTTFLMYSGIGAVFAESNIQTVIVSEKVPGADCICIADGALDNVPVDGMVPTLPGKGEAACGASVTTRKYQCTIEPGLAGFQQMFATIIRWFVNIVMLCGVLAIVGLGIAWSLAGGDDAKAKGELKKWGINILVGMIILFFFSYILQFLAPWIYK